MTTRPEPILIPLNGAFWLHLAITLFAWVGPFLIDWWLMCAIYAIVLLQFAVLNKCVVNAGHDLEEGEGITFYAFLFESFGIYFPRKPLKWVVRGPLYLILGILTWYLQVYLGYKPVVHLDWF